VRLLDITVDIGPGARPAQLENLLTGIRVAVDVARDADTRRARRIAEVTMRFPTDDELRAAVERFPHGDELSLSYRAERQIEARRLLRDEMLGAPPEIWYDWFYRRGRRPFGKLEPALKQAGFERLLSQAPFPLSPNAVGLDALDPLLYDALVADAVARSLPGQVRVRQLRYENPLFKRLFGKGAAEQTISTTAQVIETVSTLGPTRKIAKADAEVAERTVDQRVADSDLDLQLKRLRVQREQEALIAERIANARALEALQADRHQRAIAEAAARDGQLDIADAVRDLNAADAAALGELGQHRLELELHYELDDDERAG
jgi:hypothetical protein